MLFLMVARKVGHLGGDISVSVSLWPWPPRSGCGSARPLCELQREQWAARKVGGISKTVTAFSWLLILCLTNLSYVMLPLNRMVIVMWDVEVKNKGEVVSEWNCFVKSMVKPGRMVSVALSVSAVCVQYDHTRRPIWPQGLCGCNALWWLLYHTFWAQ